MNKLKLFIYLNWFSIIIRNYLLSKSNLSESRLTLCFSFPIEPNWTDYTISIMSELAKIFLYFGSALSKCSIFSHMINKPKIVNPFYVESMVATSIILDSSTVSFYSSYFFSSFFCFYAEYD